MKIPDGYRRQRYEDKRATHAICKCGELVPADADSHRCRWWPLVKIERAPKPWFRQGAKMKITTVSIDSTTKELQDQISEFLSSDMCPRKLY